MTVPIIGGAKSKLPSDVIQEYIERCHRQDNTTRQDRETLYALVMVVEGLIRRVMKQEGVELSPEAEAAAPAPDPGTIVFVPPGGEPPEWAKVEAEAPEAANASG